jgi:hypothetical protein
MMLSEFLGLVWADKLVPALYNQSKKGRKLLGNAYKHREESCWTLWGYGDCNYRDIGIEPNQA